MIDLSELDVTTNFQEKNHIFDRYFFLKRESISIEIHVLLSRNHTRVSCYNALTSSR